MKRINNRLALVLCLTLGVAACSSEKTAEDYLIAAKENIKASKNANAIIALKNAIRVDLKNPEARALLGSLYLNMGEAGAAEKELKRALELSGNIDDTLPKLLKAFNLQRKNDEIIAFTSELEQPTPEILLYQALAYNRLGEKEKSKQLVVHANEISTESIYSQLGNAYLKADSSDIKGALDNIDSILAVAPGLTEALILKGQLHFAENDFPNALVAFNEYHKLLPNDVQIRLFLANTYVKNEQFDEANKHIDFLLKLVPEHPFVNQLKGLVYYQKLEYKQALAHTEKAIHNGLDTSANRVVAGLSAFKLVQYEIAHGYLVTLIEILPPTHPVRRVLAVVQLELGYSTDAGSVLEELEGLTSQDVNLFTTASAELLKAGKIKEAKKLLSKTDAISIDSSPEMTKLGALKFSMNDLEGITDLEKAVEIDPEFKVAKVALAAAYIKSEEYEKALSLAEQWKQSSPDKVEGYNLTAKIHLLQKDIVAAEAQFNRALSINENNPYSLLYFANKAIVNNSPEEAVIRLEQLLSSSPDHLKGLALNYRAYKILNTSDIAVEKIKKSFLENENNIYYRLLYSRVLFIENQFDEVIKLLKEVNTEESIPTIYWALLGDSYLKVSKSEKALEVYNKWIKAQPQYRLAWLKKISTQERLVDFRGALSTVDKALAKSPGDEQFTTLRINYLILNKQFKDAQIQIENLTTEQKKLPLVKGLQAKIWLTEGKFKKALSGLEELYEIVPNQYNVTLLLLTYKKLEQEEAAFQFIKRHVESYPQDNASRTLLAEIAINFDKDLAKEQYLILLKAAPENLSILNNLAWVEYQLKNYESANLHVTDALKLSPDHPHIMDTAAQIQLKLGNEKKAIELISRARKLAPNDKEIAKHYKEVLGQ